MKLFMKIATMERLNSEFEEIKKAKLIALQQELVHIRKYMVEKSVLFDYVTDGQKKPQEEIREYYLQIQHEMMSDRKNDEQRILKEMMDTLSRMNDIDPEMQSQ